MIKNVVLDIGGVLVDYHTLDYYTARGYSISAARELQKVTMGSPYWEHFDIGLMPYDWVLDKMNKDRTVVRCSAYKLPISALLAYWKGLYGGLDSPYTMKNRTNFNIRMYEQVEVVLLDEEDDEIEVRVDRVPTMLMTNGHEFTDRNIQDWRTSGDVRALWEKTNVFNSFFVSLILAISLLLYCRVDSQELYHPYFIIDGEADS